MATYLMNGKRLADFHLPAEIPLRGRYIKAPVFPFIKFPDEDVLLGPEMKSTGEVMGVGDRFGVAFAKALIAAGNRLPLEGTVFVSVNDRDKTCIASDCIHASPARFLAGSQSIICFFSCGVIQ